MIIITTNNSFISNVRRVSFIIKLILLSLFLFSNTTLLGMFIIAALVQKGVARGEVQLKYKNQYY